ncbi:MAG: cellulase family glycosylhydrolase [Nitrososphaeria archaeon]
MTKKFKSSTFFYTFMILTILFIGMCVSQAVTYFINIVTIRSSGKIGVISPLHVDGKNIKDSFGNTVILRGVNKAEFADDPDGIWMGDTRWKDANVKAELDAMKSWGVNVVRCHISVELWKYDIGPTTNITEHPILRSGVTSWSQVCSISTREAIKRFLNFAAEKGMYVVLDAYSTRCYWTRAEQDQLPFPPYQQSPNASEIIGSVDDFVEWWRSVAEELKGYPNVLFELWNEPNRNNPPTAFNEWLNAAQLCINAIRNAGATQPIIFQWQMGIWCNVYEDENGEPFARWGDHLRSWLETAVANLTDPLGNLIFSTHIYRVYSGLGQYITPSVIQKWNSTFPYNYTHIKVALEHMGIKWAVESLNVPLFIGEIGAAMDWGPTEHQHEMTAWNNTLTILNDWGIHYTAFWWREIGTFRLHNGPPNFTPNEAGQILIEKIKR